MICQGGLRISKKLQQIPNVFNRPRLTKADKFVMLMYAITKQNPY